ncbi:hypothetical protein CP532_2069 [Ophiocordyceps camponoti-leonardi (nom. inval.)]|nr:hypothetical protein CP532_2069 [Ophiocordyceps camponoti-leonardi (nom. inval.)]
MRTNPDVLNANNSTAKEWLKLVDSYDHLDAPRSRVEAIASQHRQGQPCRVIQRIYGAFNYCFRVRFLEDDDQWIIRFPMPGHTKNPLQKTQNEAAVMRFIQSNTMIPIPKFIASGVAEGEFEGLGPYIVMEFVQGTSLDDLILEDDEEWNLKRDCPIETIRILYRQIADIYLQLFQHSFPKIGSLSLVEGDGVAPPSWGVTSGPLTFKMNEMERMGGVRVGASDGPFDLASDYFEALADQSLSHLFDNPRSAQTAQEFQDDHKSIRVLRSLAKHFGTNSSNAGNQHKLFCDDLRIGNILVDESSYRIVAVLDWEFCYVAPQGFLCAPPYWLIGSEPFEWKESDVVFYKEKVDLFLELLEEEEERCRVDHTLSRLMRESMRDGSFWYNMAIRESFPLSDVMVHVKDIDVFQKASISVSQTASSSVNPICEREDFLDETRPKRSWLPLFLSAPNVINLQVQL